MSYTPVGWANDTTHPLSQANMKTLDAGIVDAHERGLRQVVTFTASGTFSKGTYPWLRAVKIRVQGAGGGGGGCATTDTAQAAAAGSGAAGVYSETLVLASALAVDETVTVGAAGTAGAVGANAGGTGGTSSFGTHASGNGGGGGGAGPAQGSIPRAGGSGGIANTTGTGDLVVPGQGGQTTSLFLSGMAGAVGGSSVLGHAPRSAVSTTGGTGVSGEGYGSGGNGGFNTEAQSTTAKAGGPGAPGIVIVELYG